MSAAFIPVFSEYLTQRTKRDAWELASAAFTTLLTILTGVCVLGIFASPWIVRLIAPGFSGDAEQQALTTLLTRIMFPYLLFIGLAALAMGVLNSVRSFAAPAFSPVLFNIAIIAAAFLLAPLFAEPILAVAVEDRLRERSEEHTSELQSLAYLVCRLLLEKKKKTE